MPHLSGVIGAAGRHPRECLYGTDSLVVGAIVVAAIAKQRGVEPALMIVVVGIVVSFVPGFVAP